MVNPGSALFVTTRKVSGVVALTEPFIFRAVTEI
jgi:hypothetical protein